jgi:hypothetical protein
MNKHERRKAHPIYTGGLKYFPHALLYVSEVSLAGNRQHHPDKPLHWDMSKSTDEADALVRHLLDAGKFDDDGLRHTGKVAWRALALLERELLEAKYVELNDEPYRHEDAVEYPPNSFEDKLSDFQLYLRTTLTKYNLIGISMMKFKKKFKVLLIN